jgi:hypothetical protein
MEYRSVARTVPIEETQNKRGYTSISLSGIRTQHPNIRAALKYVPNRIYNPMVFRV